MARLYFFDLKGEIRRRDHIGKKLADPAEAIRHGDLEAWKLVAGNPRLTATDCYISVTEETGCEIHRAALIRVMQRTAA